MVWRVVLELDIKIYISLSNLPYNQKPYKRLLCVPSVGSRLREVARAQAHIRIVLNLKESFSGLHRKEVGKTFRALSGVASKLRALQTPPFSKPHGRGHAIYGVSLACGVPE